MTPLNNLKIYFIFIFLNCVIPSFAQDKLELIHADIVKGEKTPIGNAIIANGNVHFRQGSMEMFCQRVTWYKDQHETVFEQNVKIEDRSKILLADKVFYNDLTRLTRAIGNVVLIDSLHKLCADRANYYENEDHINADDNVIITDAENEVVLTGGHAEYWRNKEYAHVTINPVLIKKDSTGKEEIRVIGNKMELFEGGERSIVSENVEITHKNGKANCNRAEYFKSENRLLLQEEPVVTQKYDKLSGNEIELFFEHEKLRKVIITKQALVTSPVDTTQKDDRFNKLLGDKITLFMEDNLLKDVLVEGKATCYYHILEKGEYKGRNKVIGDKITMNIDKGEIVKIIIESDPESSSGIYYPPELEKQKI